ncbi:3-isopropylmalate dehydratase large subunit, chloroplastic-like [Pyrus x bretschneideri]|uniref:3-isopropylmalate dehydratase large subunit, chloroplastic-like n=1 Tax=Pyrus x bretschneideri TaxID=225117 RepID=UPI00202F95BD|nr:3-isopropylmalate dehydratase large subunit, chloroplastic-like [Pyrus x bretschneideri]XP_048430517.1 3-isopropylmalate dehydratase large subunit, chloroplastic-like [Pyrus x bretschneideri]
MAAARVFLASGKKVKVPTFLVPATQRVWTDVYSLPVPGSGGKTCSQIFEEAECDTPASPSCGARLGGPKDTYARLNEPQASTSFSAIHPQGSNVLSCLGAAGPHALLHFTISLSSIELGPTSLPLGVS